MLLTPTIPKAPSTVPGRDQQQLFARGLSHLRRLVRRVWTDHNVHDPGITILELLCYALTDVSYRASFPVEDLLARAEGDAGAGRFPTARQVLTSRPLTALDYRKLLIDLPGVRNAWIEPVAEVLWADPVTGTLQRPAVGPLPVGFCEVKLRGLYRAVLDYMDGVDDADKPAVNARALALLQANRNLCEDFEVDEQGIARQSFLLCAELDFAPDADAVAVQAEILFVVARHLAPPVWNAALSERLARRQGDGGAAAEEIFDGPPLTTGFFDDGELVRAALRRDDPFLYLSDVISLIMDVPGVLAVRGIVLNPAPQEGEEPMSPADKWRIAVDPERRPELDWRASRLVLTKRNLPVAPRRSEVAARYLEAEERIKLETVLDGAELDLPVPPGRFRRPGDYTSFQNHFPALYGLGEAGLPPGAGAVREAQALQLKAYLLFFDQVMADACAQLAEIGELLSADPELAHTYATQVVDSFAGFVRIYAEGTADHPLAEFLAAAAEDAAIRAERRGRFLDHLIARFGERFHDSVAVLRSAFGASPESAEREKCALLAEAPRLGAERGLAYDQSLTAPGDLWDSANISGFERRLARLLGLCPPSRRDLSQIALGPQAEVGGSSDGFRFRWRQHQGSKVLFHGLKHYADAELARQALRQALAAAQLPAGYQRGTAADGTFFFNLVDAGGALLARSPKFFTTAAARDAAIDILIDDVREHAGAEGMYVIENLLLRPLGGDDPLLPICAGAACACTDCPGLDPYSYRLHVVLPAFAGRFADMGFRRFAEEVIREEAPAHLLLKICWVGRADMAAVEQAYRGWLAARAGGPGGDDAARRGRLAALLAVLRTVKNVYPEGHLHACDDPQGRPPFLLGRTALGSE